jgi:hypothetical protein
MFRPIYLAILLLLGTTAARAEKVQFNRDVRPILSNYCFYCHGPDEKKREADLRLDERKAALAEHDGVRAIVPGKPAESELLVRIVSHDRDEVMPPPKAKKPPLTPEQIATLRRWIEEGAEYEGHWAFLPLRDEKPPVIAGGARIADWEKRAPSVGAKMRREQAFLESWVRNPIDAFILDRLLAEGVVPSREADAATLCRRMYLDLTGLLPTPEEVRAFEQAASRNRQSAIEALADQLLASPHYGERWGRHWLDQARYADSNGYTIDSERTMWPYRDWVIKALNDDLPFDRFTIEQLAGDLLPEPTRSQLIATAFHRNTLINEEGGTKPEQFRVEAAIDRVNTTGAVWLGLTVGCAQCHTHKFDPITHREYYEMFAFFNQGEDVNNKGATLSVARGEVFGQPAIPLAELPAAVGDLAARQTEWEERELARQPASKAAVATWTPAQLLEYDTLSGAGFQRLEDNSLLSDGGASFNDTYRVLANATTGKVAAVRLRVLTHESLPKQGPGLAGNGNFVLTGFDVLVAGEEQPISSAVADHEQPKYPASAAIDDDAKSGWAINIAKGATTRMNAPHEAVFILEKPVDAQGRPVEIRLHHDANENYLIGRFALDFSTVAPTAGASSEDALLTVLRIPAESRNDEQKKLAREAFFKADPELRKATQAAAKGNPNVAELMVMRDAAKPRPTFLFQRGDFLRPDEKLGELQPGTIAAVAPAFSRTAKRTRLDLAQWLVNPANPLTPRVTVNRLWMHYFGRGLVETEEDFGTQGTPPTHPELLDWLGREFIRRGWSVKTIHKLIVTSATYAQSSHSRPDLLEKDPRNLWLARQERVRVEAEIVRDAALSASGLLDRTIGGPGVRPPQPEGVYAFTQNDKKWKPDTGPARYRRALYTKFYRSAPYPLFGTFDAPDFQTVCTRRARSNTPLQALTVANDPAFLEFAQGLATRVLREMPNDDTEARLKRTFALALSREPTVKELGVLRAFHDRQLASFTLDTDGAKTLLSTELAAIETKPEVAAAQVSVARTLFNTDGFITRE